MALERCNESLVEERQKTLKGNPFNQIEDDETVTSLDSRRICNELLDLLERTQISVESRDTVSIQTTREAETIDSKVAASGFESDKPRKKDTPALMEMIEPLLPEDCEKEKEIHSVSSYNATDPLTATSDCLKLREATETQTQLGK